MSVTLQGLKNITVRCGNTDIPLVKVIISATNEYEPIGRDFLENVYALSAGMVATTTVRVNPVSDPNLIPNAIQVYTPGNYDIGDNNGFKFNFNVEQYGGTGHPINGVNELRLYFKGVMVARATDYTGVAPFACSYLPIFVDENDNIFTDANTNVCGIYVKYDINPGVSVSNDITMAPIVPGYELHTTGVSAEFRKSNLNISDYISGEIDYTNNDPYKPGGDTGNDETGGTGGTGDFDGTSDPVDFPNLPNLSAVDTGFITLFNPSASQLKSLANYMWSGLFDIDTFKKIFANPMDCILGLSIVPVNVPSGGSDTVKVGNISTGVSMTKATSQYVSVDCGTLNVNEFWGAYLDYSPYTKAEIYLPYVGTHPLDIDDIMNKPVHVKYHIDILSGACIAFIKCGDSVLYSFIGQCSSSIPITGNDWTNVINGVINIAGAVGSMVMTGGMSAPMAIGQIASTAVNSSKPSVEKSGSLSGTGGMLGVQTPYMILTRPQQALPAQQNVYTGYPSFITRTLSSVSGYTEVDRIHLENVPGTESELSEIETLLKTGVIF